LYESSKISLPLVIGFLKPVVLLPVGLVTNLSQKQIEAILAHELAHIKRNDFIINVLQNIVEIIFFFHPALWWLSNKIREERENCCDDVAIELIGEKIHLVKALANVESYRQNPALAMAFGKKRFTLLERVQRILGIEANQNKTQESLFFVMVFVGIVVAYFVFQTNEVTAQTQSPKAPKTSDTLSNEYNVMRFFNGKTDVKVNKEGEIYVNGKKQEFSPEEEKKIKNHVDELVRLESKMKPYQIEMEKLGKEMDTFSEKMNVPSVDIEDISKNIEIQSKKIEEFSKQQEKYAKQMSRLQEDSKQYKDLEKEMDENEKQMEQFEKEMENYEKEMENYEKEMENYEKEIEKYHLPMDSLGGLMGRFEKPMEEVGKEMEIHSKAIIDMLPYQVRKDIENGMNFTPPPPPPPRPSKPPKISKRAILPPSTPKGVMKPAKANAPKSPKINE
jgi:predicted  nucleic acid-binding Zn-ribbon protein